MTSKALRKELFQLSVAERLELVEELWDSIPGDDEALALSPEQREDLDRRIAEAEVDPEGGSSWDAARERIQQRRQ